MERPQSFSLDIENDNCSGAGTSKMTSSDAVSACGIQPGEDQTRTHVPTSRWVMHGAIMFGREFCYATQTAMMAPLLLLIGLPEKYYSLTLLASPILGLIFTPFLGSASDCCHSSWGRRRPFILALCIAVLIGQCLFFNGVNIGSVFCDKPENKQTAGIILTVTGVVMLDFCSDAVEGPIRAYLLDVANNEQQDMALNIHALASGLGAALGYMIGGVSWMQTILSRAFSSQHQVLSLFSSIIFILGVCLHLFSIQEQPVPRIMIHKVTEDCPAPVNRGRFRLRKLSAHNLEESEIYINPYVSNCKESSLPKELCQSNSSSHLEVQGAASGPSQPQVIFFQNINLSFQGSKCTKPLVSAGQALQIFTCQYQSVGNTLIMKNEYAKDSQDASRDNSASELGNESPSLPQNLPIQIQLSASAASEKQEYESTRNTSNMVANSRQQAVNANAGFLIKASRSFSGHGKKKRQNCKANLKDGKTNAKAHDEDHLTPTTVELLWLSMFKMPWSLFCLCICHLTSWFSMLSSCFFYTDFMGQAVYGGDPTAPDNSTEAALYNSGVQMGCWGLTIYALTAALFSVFLQKCLVNIKMIYCFGPLSYSAGMALIAAYPNIYVAMVSIGTMGFLFTSTSFCPYALLGQYHDDMKYATHSPAGTRRGIGVDCAILSCQVYLGQILVASVLGVTITAFGTVRVVPVVAACSSLMSFLAAILLVTYPQDTEIKTNENTDPSMKKQEQIAREPKASVKVQLESSL